MIEFVFISICLFVYLAAHLLGSAPKQSLDGCALVERPHLSKLATRHHTMRANRTKCSIQVAASVKLHKHCPSVYLSSCSLDSLFVHASVSNRQAMPEGAGQTPGELEERQEINYLHPTDRQTDTRMGTLAACTLSIVALCVSPSRLIYNELPYLAAVSSQSKAAQWLI